MSESAPIGLSILVPAYNERGTIRQVLEKVRAVGFPVKTEIVVVDDGSRDGTIDVLRQLPRWEDVRVFFHEKNLGKGGRSRPPCATLAAR